MGYALLLVGISSILLSFLLLYQNKGQYNIRFDFGMLMTFAGLWAVFVGIFFVSRGNLLAINLNYIVALMMVYLLAGFSMRLDGRRSSLVAISHTVGLVLSIALSSVLLYNTTWVISSVDFISTTNVAVQISSLGYSLYALAFVTAYGVSVLFLINAISRSLGSERHKYVQILVSILIVGFTGLIMNLYLPSIGKYTFIWSAPFLVVLVVLTSSVSIVRYKTFDIKLAAVRSVAYFLSLLTLAGIYYAVAYLFSVAVFQGEVNSSFSLSPLNILLALGLAFIFQPIKNLFDKITDDIFYRDRYNSDEFYARLSEVLTSTTDLRNLLQRAAHEIGTTLKSEQTFFFVQYNHSHHVSAGTSHHVSLPVEDAHELNEYVVKNGGDTLITNLLPVTDRIHRLLTSHRIEVLMPLMRGPRVIGYLGLGDQRTTGYTNRDMRVLQTVSDELVIAIQNALSVQEVKDINIHLEQRIDSATKELQKSNTQLRHLDTTKDEFLSMASHQLRTPLTSVKGYLSMVLEGDAGKITDMQKHLLSEAFTSSERMVHLIHDFLNVSRLQTGKFVLEQHPFDLAKLVKEEVDSLRRTAQSRSMKLKLVNKVGELMLNIDENKIRQVVMNFVDNALYYSHENTTIIISLEENGENIEFKVVDTGIGVPKSEQAQLFSKFYRASNARKQRPDGTGVGIFLAKKVVTSHGGDVLFESTEGKGSTFGFTLPVKKLRIKSDDKTN